MKNKVIFMASILCFFTGVTFPAVAQATASPPPVIIYPTGGDISTMYTLTITLDAEASGGKVRLDPPGQLVGDSVSYYEPGLTVTLTGLAPTPSPCPGCPYLAFSGFSGDLDENNQVYLDGNKNVTASFVLKTSAGVTPTAPPLPRLGDVNANGQVDIVDALMIARYSVGLQDTGFYPEVADVDGDGDIDIVDALRVASYYVAPIEFPLATG